MRSLSVLLLLMAVTCVCGTTAHAGYTHSWTWHQKPGDQELKTCLDEMKRIIEARAAIIAGPDGSGAVVFDVLHLSLNGVGDDAHETFAFPGELGFNLCKTEGKPYDAVVVACLLVARDHFPATALSIESDGSWSASDWQNGIELYSSVLGRTARNPMNSTESMAEWPHSPLSIVSGAVAGAVIAIVFWLKKNPKRL